MWPNTHYSPPTSPGEQAQIDCYTPSNEDQQSQDFFGRRRLRIAAGQDPEKQPEKFTPPPRHHWAHFVWPTNEEAYAWAEVGRKKRAAHNLLIREEAEREKQMKKLKTPSCGAGSSAEPVTDENNPLGNAPVEGPPVPFQLEE